MLLPSEHALTARWKNRALAASCRDPAGLAGVRHELGSDLLNRLQDECCSSGRQRKHEGSYRTGEQGSDQNPDLHLILQRGMVREGQEADEEAHREADPANQGNAEQLRPGCVVRTRRQAEPHSGPSADQDPGLLSNEEACGDAERYGLEQVCRLHSRERNAGVGKAEGRHHQERDPRLNAMLKGVQGRVCVL
jgi:hypothetical protein